MPSVSREGQNQSDDELIRLAKTGDGKATAELFEKHHGKIYSFLYRATGRREDAEDLCQEVFLVAFKNISSFRGESAFSTWVFRIAINRFRDYLRKEKQRPLPMQRDFDEDVLTGSEDTRATISSPLRDELSIQVISVQDLRDSLRRIDPKYRIPLLLNALEDMPYQDIARVLRLPVGTVKSRIFRARVMLAEMLGEERAAREKRGTKRTLFKSKSMRKKETCQ